MERLRPSPFHWSLAPQMNFMSGRGVHYEQSQSISGLLASSYGKMPGLVLRLALVLEYLEWAHAEGGTSEPAHVTLTTLSRSLVSRRGLS